jgi:LuxR family maltose regulon positive regulatory protein
VNFLPSANLGLAALALDQEKLVDAADLVDRYLRTFPPEDWMERAAGLELAIQVNLRLGDVDKATRALIELKASAAAIGTGPFQASVWFGEGLLAACKGEYALAKGHFEDAIDRWTQTGSPFEAAHACLELARTLFALGRADAALEQARRASDILASLGAERATARARTLLAELRNALCTQPDEVDGLDLQTAGAPPTHFPLVASLPSQRLSPRELEVLRLVAQGLSNQKIADHLVLSQHTIHRHMANILTKLGLPSRAAATAYAAQHGLL